MASDEDGTDHQRLSRRDFCGVAAPAGIIGTIAATVPSQASQGKMSKRAESDLVTIYHLEGRRSIRIIWLCEELGIPYKLMFKPGDAAASRKMMQAVNPLMPTWPTVVYRGHMMMESGGIVDYIMSQVGNGRLIPAKNSPDLAGHYQWMHFAEGTAMYRLWATRYASMVAKIPVEQVPRGYQGVQEDPNVPGKLLGANALVGPDAVFKFIEAWLREKPYFGGAQFSTADIMMHFVGITARMGAIDINDYPAFAAWKKKVEQRPACVRARKAAMVDDNNFPTTGLPAALPPLPPKKTPTP